MRKPIRDYLKEKGYIEDPITEEKPFLSKIQLEYATKSRFRSPNGYIEIQEFEGCSYYIMYYESNLIKPEYFPFDFGHSNIYFRFNIEGDYILHNLETELYKQSKEGTYAPAYHSNGKFGVQLQGGITKLFTVIFSSNWPKLNFVKNSHLQPLADIIGMPTRPQTTVALMDVNIAKIENYLTVIYKMTGNPAIIRADIKKIFVKICVNYNQQFTEKLTYAWVEAETYMHDNIDEDPVKIDFFLEEYSISKAPFYKNFKAEYGNTPVDHQYLVKIGIIKRGNYHTTISTIVKIIENTKKS